MKSNETRHSLILRACNVQDEDAWEELVIQYRRFICYILTEMGLESEDVDDVCQQVLVSLSRDIDSYDKSKGGFRNWLSVVIRNAAFSHFKKQKRYSIRLQRFGEQLEINAPVEGGSELDIIIEEEWMTYIGNLAMDRVREFFQGQAVKVFEMGLNGISADEIAAKSGLTVASVYTLKKRVKKRLLTRSQSSH